jgi:hypothetical protein
VITLASALILKKNTLVDINMGPWLWLFEVNRDDLNVLRYTNDVRDTPFDSYTWARRAMEVLPPQSDIGGSVVNFRVSLDNVDRAITSSLEANEIKGQPAALYRVHADHLDSPANARIWRGLVVNVDGDLNNITLICGNHDPAGANMPAGKYNRLRCRWKFSAPGNRNDTCAYSGGLTTCDKSFADCQARGNQARFGGFPGIPVGNQ